ncbi:MAG: UDP-N-acetylmuramate--L-alanine ligase [Elusimicrobiota bacterium]
MKYYFVGIAGFGMSALAQIARGQGHEVWGSDRNFDSGKAEKLREKFIEKGIRICPQDGSALDKSFDAAIFSTAVEESNPEFQKASGLGIKIIHRSDFLAQYVNRFKTIAVSGTSGKSTVTALIYHILERNGFSPWLITGGALNELIEKGEIGNAACGKSEWLVIEADESDGTLVKYRPYAGVILNISKDHKDISQLMDIFKTFAANSGKLFVNADDSLLGDISGRKFFFGLKSDETRFSDIELRFDSSSFKLNSVPFELPLPGLHNVANLAAAARVCCEVASISMRQVAEAVKDFKGVYRRFNLLGEKNGVLVIDDFAHNPAKIEAALSAASLEIKGKIIAIYQPHGFAPTRMLKNELIESFARSLRSEDLLIMPQIYYAGGTVSKDISSLDIVKALQSKGKRGIYFENRSDIPAQIKKLAMPKDRVIVMGARDLTLRDFALDILNSL